MRWRSKGYGFKVDNITSLNHAVWADNVFLLACSLGQMLEMVEELTVALYDGGLEWKIGNPDRQKMGGFYCRGFLRTTCGSAYPAP